MKNIVIAFLSVLTLNSCNAQTDYNTKSKKDNVEKQNIEPKVDYKVNKEYDENGNLIKYDSTYIYYYSNIDKKAMKNDSVYKKLIEHFNNSELYRENSFLDNFLNQNNHLNDDFFNDDFFSENFKRNQEMMRKLLSRMDTLKNEFFLEQYPLKKDKKMSSANK
jgi:hypothetical protein